MRNVRHQFGVTLATRPGVLGKRGSFPAVNHIMMHAGMIGRCLEQVAQNLNRFHRARPWGLIGKLVAAHQMQRQIRARFDLIGIFVRDRAQARDVVIVGMMRSRIPARYDRRNIHLFQIGGFARNCRQFLGLIGRFDRPRLRLQRIALAERLVVAIQLEARPVVAGRDHRHAPPRHRRVRIEFGGLAEAALRFQRPERMQLRYALIEKLLRLRVRCSDREMYLALAGHKLGGQLRRYSAGRRRAGVPLLGLRGQQAGSHQKRAAGFHKTASSVECSASAET